MMERNELIQALIWKVSHNEALSQQDRQTLLALLAELDQQVMDLARTHKSEAQQISEITTVQKLQNAVSVFEATHPQLVETVNRLCVMLANVGI